MNSQMPLRPEFSTRSLLERSVRLPKQLLKTITENRKPFDDSWIDWRPDPAWELPQLPDDWEHV
jgi:hypothetical protein